MKYAVKKADFDLCCLWRHLLSFMSNRARAFKLKCYTEAIVCGEQRNLNSGFTHSLQAKLWLLTSWRIMTISARGKTWDVRAPPIQLSWAELSSLELGDENEQVKKFERLATRIKFNMAAAVAPQPQKKTLSKNLMEMKVRYSKVTIKYLYSTLLIFLFIFSSWGGKQNQTIAANLKKSDSVLLKNRIGYWTRKKKMIGQLNKMK